MIVWKGVYSFMLAFNFSKFVSEIYPFLKAISQFTHFALDHATAYVNSHSAISLSRRVLYEIQSKVWSTNFRVGVVTPFFCWWRTGGGVSRLLCLQDIRGEGYTKRKVIPFLDVPKRLQNVTKSFDLQIRPTPSLPHLTLLMSSSNHFACLFKERNVFFFFKRTTNIWIYN